MPPQLINEQVIKIIYSRWYSEKLVASTEIEYFQYGPNLSLEIPC